MQKTLLYRNVKFFIILIIGLSISIGSFYHLNNLQIQNNERLVDLAIQETNKKISKELKKATLAISSLEVLFKSSSKISRDLFSQFTIPFIEGLPGIKALEWALMVPDSNRVVYEATIQSEGFKNFSITQADSSNKKLVTAQQKSSYFPIHYIVPTQLNELALGMDLSSNKARLTCIENSIRNQTISVSPPIKLINNTNGSISFLILQTVQKRRKTKGVILGVYNMDDFINTVLQKELELLTIRIYDKTANYRSMYSNSKGRPLAPSASTAANILTNHFEINMGDRIWAIYYAPNEQMAAYPHLAISYACLFFGLLITFLVIMMVYTSTNAKIQLEHKVNARTKELNIANKQQAVLLKEIHHRVKNNLQVITSLLSLQSSNIEDSKTREIFSVSQYRINAMAMLHEELYQSVDLSRIGYGQYLEKLVQHLLVSIKGVKNNIDVSIDVPENLRLNIDTAIPLGLLINEIITNSLKYGFPNQSQGNIYIHIEQKTRPHLQVQIGDTGQGFPDSINYRTSKSLGLKLIRQLTRQLKGTVEKDRSKKGTHYILNIQEIE